jgi:hypothetical protein
VSDAVRDGLVNEGLDAAVVDELLEAHAEAKRNFYLGGLRLAEVEGGRFSEAAFRLLEQQTTGAFTPLGQSVDTQAIIRALEQTPVGSHPDSVRLHIPRALRVIYDIRNNRDAAHLADGIDPNLQDATLVATTADWVLAEFIRLHHGVSPDEAQRIVTDLVSRQAPVIQDFEGFLKVLDPSMRAGDRVLVLLYQRGADGASYAELESWVHPKSRANLGATLERLVEDKSFIHQAKDQFWITQAGEREVEERRLFDVGSG